MDDVYSTQPVICDRKNPAAEAKKDGHEIDLLPRAASLAMISSPVLKRQLILGGTDGSNPSLFTSESANRRLLGLDFIDHLDYGLGSNGGHIHSQTVDGEGANRRGLIP